MAEPYLFGFPESIVAINFPGAGGLLTVELTMIALEGGNQNGSVYAWQAAKKPQAYKFADKSTLPGANTLPVVILTTSGAGPTALPLNLNDGTPEPIAINPIPPALLKHGWAWVSPVPENYNIAGNASALAFFNLGPLMPAGNKSFSVDIALNIPGGNLDTWAVQAATWRNQISFPATNDELGNMTLRDLSKAVSVANLSGQHVLFAPDTLIRVIVRPKSLQTSVIQLQ